MNELPSQLTGVNTTDIPDAIRLGCRVMERVFNADDDRGVAFFGAQLWPACRLDFSSCHSEAHVPGRHLNALLNAEHALGTPLDERAVEAHARAALFSFSGPVPLPLNRERIGGPLVYFCPHNLREGFHALYALVRFRGSREAADLAERSLAAITDFWKPDRGWDESRLQAAGVQLQACEGFLHGEARLLGPLVKYHRATGSASALELAKRFKEIALEHHFHADGSFDPNRFGTTHAHSITCVLSSLAQLAEFLDDASLLARVKAFYDNGLWHMRDEIGWSPESIGQRDTDRGEANNTGDILETALILGMHGFAKCFHDAERILRCHLLPSQLRDVSFAVAAPNPSGCDGSRDVPGRLRGAFGFPSPYGHQPVPNRHGTILFNLDIVGGTVASLCEAWRAAVTRTPDGLRVNLLFDRDTDLLRVRSPYTHPLLEITPKQSGTLLVRIPPWARPKPPRIRSGKPPTVDGDFLRFDNPSPGKPLDIELVLHESELCLDHLVHPKPIRVRLRGDCVVTMEGCGAALRFFPDYGSA